jgi:hypothetical protein
MNFVVFPTLVCCLKKEVFDGEKLLAEHSNA